MQPANLKNNIKNNECLEKGTARTFKHGDLLFFSVHSLGKIYALEFTSQWLSLPGKVMVAQCLGGYIGKGLLG